MDNVRLLFDDTDVVQYGNGTYGSRGIAMGGQAMMMSLGKIKEKAKAIGAHLELELSSLTKTFEELRSDHLKDAAELIAEAPRVFFLGFALEEGFARYARLLFARLRHNTMILGPAPAPGPRIWP